MTAAAAWLLAGAPELVAEASDEPEPVLVGLPVPEAEAEDEVDSGSTASIWILPQRASLFWMQLNCSVASCPVALMQASYQNLHIWPGTVCSYEAIDWVMSVPLEHLQV
jgi:hypothetical protein